MSDQTVYIAIVEARVSAGAFARTLYQDSASPNVRYFLQLNSIDENTVLAPGSVVVVPSNPSGACTVIEQQAAAELRALRESGGGGIIEHPKITIDLYGLFEYIQNQSGVSHGAGALGAYGVALSTQVDHVRGILLRLQALYQETYRATGDLIGPNFSAQRRDLFSQLDNLLRGWIRGRLIDPDQPSIRRALRISKKSTVLEWKRAGSTAGGVPALNRHIQSLNRFSDTVRRVGYVAIGLDVIWSTREIIMHLQSNQPDSGRQATGVFGSLLGNIGGGYYGGLGGAALGYAVCNAILGVPTAGTSVFWCAILAGGVGAFGGGLVGGYLGQQGGYLLYDSLAPNLVPDPTQPFINRLR